MKAVLMILCLAAFIYPSPKHFLLKTDGETEDDEADRKEAGQDYGDYEDYEENYSDEGKGDKVKHEEDSSHEKSTRHYHFSALDF